MIELERVSKWYGGAGSGGGGAVHAVRDLSLSIARGQCVGLLGPNGAGKTTTIRMITGFMPPSAGTIRVEGKHTIEESIEARRRIGYLPEATPLFPEMRVVDFLHYRGKLFGLERAARMSGVEEAMTRCWLKDVARRRIGQLSKGFKQRVGLAAALVHRPAVLILDEPTNGLDPSQIQAARSLIKELAQDRTVLVSSHILPEIEQTCDRVIIIARGRVRADGSPRELVSGVQDALPHDLEVKATAAALAELVRGLEATTGVASIRTEPMNSAQEESGSEVAWTRLVVTPKSGVRDLREQLAAAAIRLGLPVREVHRRQAQLEQVFLRVIETEEGP